MNQREFLKNITIVGTMLVSRAGDIFNRAREVAHGGAIRHIDLPGSYRIPYDYLGGLARDFMYTPGAYRAGMLATPLAAAGLTGAAGMAGLDALTSSNDKKDNLASHRGYYSYLDKLAGVEGVALEAAIPLGQQILAKIRAGIVPGLIGTGIIAPVGYGLYRGARALMSDDDPGGLIENEMDVPWYQKRQGVTAAGAGLGATLGGIGGGMTLGGIGTITGGILGGVGGAVVADSLYPYIPR